MIIKSKTYYTIVSEIQKYQDPDTYASDLSLSSIWADNEEESISEDRFQALIQLHTLATMPFKDLLRTAGYTQKEFSIRFLIPKRTVESWCSSAASARDCPAYTKMMICECLGLIPFSIQ